MKPTKCPAREKKNEARKVKKRGGEKAKGKVKTAVSLLNPKTILKFCFLYIPELRKLILQLDQKAVKCTTCKQLCGKF